ncbi:hypothetical protein [Streptomyces sp. NPDC052721]
MGPSTTTASTGSPTVRKYPSYTAGPATSVTHCATPAPHSSSAR